MSCANGRRWQIATNRQHPDSERRRAPYAACSGGMITTRRPSWKPGEAQSLKDNGMTAMADRRARFPCGRVDRRAPKRRDERAQAIISLLLHRESPQSVAVDSARLAVAPDQRCAAADRDKPGADHQNAAPADDRHRPLPGPEPRTFLEVPVLTHATLTGLHLSCAGGWRNRLISSGGR